jgi:hypothetical protein
MDERVYTHPLFEEVTTRNLQRISACSYTVSVVREEIVDPVLIDRRADLLIAVEDLVNEVMTSRVGSSRDDVARQRSPPVLRPPTQN